MSGQPLEEAKKSAIMLVEKMSQTDRISIITYDDFHKLQFHQLYVIINDI